MLEVGLADDAGLSVGRAERVWRLEAVQAEDADAARGQLGNGGAPHRAEPHDDDVPRVHGAHDIARIASRVV